MNDANSKCVESMNLTTNNDSYEQYASDELIAEKLDLYSRRVSRKAIRKGRDLNTCAYPKELAEKLFGKLAEK